MPVSQGLQFPEYVRRSYAIGLDINPVIEWVGRGLKFLAVALAVCCWLFPDGQSNAAAAPDRHREVRSQSLGLAAALALYANGEEGRAFDAVGPLVATGGLETVLRRDGAAWIGAEGPGAAENRQNILSVFVLELARAELQRLQRQTRVGRYQRPAISPSELDAAWQRVRPALEWVCARWRGATSRTESERLWYLASLQLYRDFDDSALRPTLGAGMARGFEEFPGHLGHAKARFPSEPWVEVLSAERRTYSLASSVRVMRPLSEQAFLEIEWLRTNTDAPPSRARDLSNEYAYLSNHREVKRRLLPLVHEPSVQGRVHLNLASIALSFDQRIEARSHLSSVAAGTSNPCLVFLSHLLLGRLSAEGQRPNQAEIEFRRALGLFADSQSASIALAATLRQSGRFSEALAIVESAFGQEPIADDPWTAWQNGGHCTEWFTYEPHLRATWR